MLMPRLFGENLIDDMFDDMFDDVFDLPAIPNREMKKAQKKLYGRHAARLMKTDVRDHDDHYEIDMDLPGFAKDEISVELKDGNLIVSAAKSLEKEDGKDGEKKNGKYMRKERYSGSMSRSFYIGDNVKQDDIHAKYENGVLRLCIPKPEPAKPQVEEKKYIAIEG